MHQILVFNCYLLQFLWGLDWCDYRLISNLYVLLQTANSKCILLQGKNSDLTLCHEYSRNKLLSSKNLNPFLIALHNLRIDAERVINNKNEYQLMPGELLKVRKNTHWGLETWRSHLVRTWVTSFHFIQVPPISEPYTTSLPTFISAKWNLSSKVINDIKCINMILQNKK